MLCIRMRTDEEFSQDGANPKDRRRSPLGWVMFVYFLLSRRLLLSRSMYDEVLECLYRLYIVLAFATKPTIQPVGEDRWILSLADVLASVLTLFLCFSFNLCRHPSWFNRYEIDDVSKVTLPAWPGKVWSSALGYSSGLLAQFGSSVLGCISFYLYLPLVSICISWIRCYIKVLWICCILLWCYYLYQVPSSERTCGASLVVSDGFWREIAKIQLDSILGCYR